MNSESKPKPESPHRPTLFRNWISFVGGVVGVGALFSFLLLFTLDAISKFTNPYVSILTYIIVPMFLIGGIALAFFGAWWEHRRRAKGGTTTALRIDLDNRHDRRVLVTFLSGSLVFLLLSAIGSYNAFNFSESVTFCGEVCHKVMKPELTTHNDGPHAKVACVDCHVGKGVSWFVKSKLSGSYQLYAVAFNKYPRPIPTPISNLRPARATCEQCHWPKAFSGNIDRTYTYFMDDKSNTPYSIRLLIKIGGVDPTVGPLGGIHWHILKGNDVQYIATDKKRQVIPWVRMTDSQGVVTVFKTSDFTTNDFAKYKDRIRTMDCIDCHNRPAHRFLSPNQCADRLLAKHTISPSVPWIKTNIVYALTRHYTNSVQAREGIATILYDRYPKASWVNTAISAVQQIYSKNFFPAMRSDWAAYPDNVGHMIWSGCFRCHDGQHTAVVDGRKLTISDNCNLCHTILAQGSGAQLDELTPGGQKFKHPGGDLYGDTSCTDCHTGGP